MRIVPIFPEEKPCIYAVCYDDRDDTPDEFNHLFDLWSDVEYLEKFFDDNKGDLGYYDVTVDEAVLKTITDAKELRVSLWKFANSGLDDPHTTLQSFFKPLNNYEYRIRLHQKSKARINWLRVYAIRIAPNLFVITGGAIKLTGRMEERPHTRDELFKLEKAKDFLKENGLLDETDFESLEI